MATKAVYFIQNTDGTVNFTLEPGQLNGPGGTHRDTDLRLYGQGALKWGEGVDENILRVGESFACPKKALGDYHAGRDAFDYDPETDAVRPKDEQDIGFGLGVTKPLNGQLWFNTDEIRMFMYSSIGNEWISITNVFSGSQPPDGSREGDIWYDTVNQELYAYANVQYLIIDVNTGVGGDWIIDGMHADAINDADNATTGEVIGNTGTGDGEYIISVGSATEFDDGTQPPIEGSRKTTIPVTDTIDAGAAGDGFFYHYEWVKVAKHYLRLDGSTPMEGDLDMDRYSIVNVAWPVNDWDAVNLEYIQTVLPDLYVDVIGDTMTGDLNMSAASIHFPTTGGISGVDDVAINYDSDASGAGKFLISRGLDVDDDGVGTDVVMEFTHPGDGLNEASDPVGPMIRTRNGFEVDIFDPRDIINLAYLDDRLGAFGNGLVYSGYTEVSVSGTGGTTNFNFNLVDWYNHYKLNYDPLLPADEFLVVPIPTYTQFRVANPRPLYESTPGTLGDYAFVDFHSSAPSYTGGTLYTFNMQLGSTGTAANGSTHNYSTGAPASYRIYLLGGPIGVLWNWYGNV